MCITVPDCKTKVLALTEEQQMALAPIANKSIKSIVEENPGLLVFPKELGYYGDGLNESDNFLIKIEDGYLTTSKQVGFIECNGIQLKICSRFDVQEDLLGVHSSNDQFFMYMLSKVLSINIFDMNLGLGGESPMNMLLLLFPCCLKSALSQGMYKEYQMFRHNDANVRGAIDVNRHLRENIPFAGKIAYSTREHSYDNSITELIRHTIEFAETNPMGKAVMSLIREEVSKIKVATPKYERSQRRNIMNKNLKPKIHPYYSKYKALQALCMQILNYESEFYGDNENQMKGVVFDAAWVWEEYLNKILSSQGFNHPTNKNKQGGLRIFEKPGKEDYFDNKQKGSIYPDFYSQTQIMDAKYKPLDSRGIGRDDLYQVIAYMHTMKIDLGGFISPGVKDINKVKKYKLTGYGGYICNVPMSIPQQCSDPILFKTRINESEKELIVNLKHLSILTAE